MKKLIKQNVKLFIGIIIGIIISGLGVYGTTLLTSEEVMHTETQTAKAAIDDLYTKVNNLYTATELTNYGINNYNDGYEAGIKSITDNPKKLVLDGTNGTAVSVTAGYYNEVDTTAVYAAGIKSITDNPTTLTLGSTNGTAVSVTAGYYNKVDTTAVYNSGYTAGQAAAVAYRRTFPSTTVTGDNSSTITIGKSGYIHLVADWSYGGTGSTHPSNMNGVSLYHNGTQLFESETAPRGYGHSGTNTFDRWVNKGDYIKINAWEYQDTTRITVTGYLDECGGTTSWAY